MSYDSALKHLIDTNFLEYASYVIKDRAIPFLEDGLKPVQRRILHTLHEVDDGKFHKVANVVGHTMRYHPHGDASIEAALVNMAQKNYLIDQQGNFGNILTGDPASAARYIECRLSPLARETLFSPEITHYADSYDGRNREPVFLPAKIPLLLMSGVEGIAVGLSTKILPHNFAELLQAQMAILKAEDFELYPDFPQGGLVDISQYQRGKGRVRLRAKVEVRDNKTLVIRELPFGTTTESLLASIENAIQRGKLKIASINDFTTEHVEIELRMGHGVNAQELLPRLFLYTDCETSMSLSPIVIQQQQPVELSVHQILEANTQQLVQTLEKELQMQLEKLRRRYRDLILVQIFIENKMYQILEEADDLGELKAMLRGALEPMLDEQFVPVPEESIDKLLNIPIRRITRFDADKARADLVTLAEEMNQLRQHLSQMTVYTLNWLEDLLKRYGKAHLRRTEISSFDSVDVTEVAVQDLKVGYDPESHYLGTDIRQGEPVPCSSYDRIVLFFESGSYKVIEVPQKLFIEEPLRHYERQGRLPEVSVLYRDTEDGHVYMKRFVVSQFILNKVYRFIPEVADLLYFSIDPEPLLQLHFEPKARTRVTQQLVDFAKMRVKSVSSKGNRVTEREIAKVQTLERESLPAAPGLSGTAVS